MEYEFLLYSKQEGIGTVTINRPKSLNALNGKVYDEIYGLFQEIEKDPKVLVVIITGSGDKAFAAGADIDEMQPKNEVEIRECILRVRMASDSVYGLSKPVIAAINGFALGGGCELAMCCDLRIAAEDAKFGQPEINLGIIPGAGGTQRLTQLIGMTRAKDLIYMGNMIDAKTALAFGLINKIVPRDKLMAEAMAMARNLLSKSSIVLSLAKQAITEGVNMPLPAGLDLESQCFTESFATEDRKEAMAAFLEKRRPKFKGR